MQLLTAEQVAKQLDRKPLTVYRMAWDGRLPSVRLGRDRRFPQSAVADYLRNRMEADTAKRNEKLALLREALEGAQIAGDRKEVEAVRKRIAVLEVEAATAQRVLSEAQGAA